MHNSLSFRSWFHVGRGFIYGDFQLIGTRVCSSSCQRHLPCGLTARRDGIITKRSHHPRSQNGMCAGSEYPDIQTDGTTTNLTVILLGAMTVLEKDWAPRRGKNRNEEKAAHQRPRLKLPQIRSSREARDRFSPTVPVVTGRYSARYLRTVGGFTWKVLDNCATLGSSIERLFLAIASFWPMTRELLDDGATLVSLRGRTCRTELRFSIHGFLTILLATWLPTTALIQL